MTINNSIRKFRTQEAGAFLKLGGGASFCVLGERGGKLTNVVSITYN